MTAKWIWIKGQRYYLYDSYDSWNKARDEARKHSKKNKKNKYFILQYETFGLISEMKYALYMNKVIKLW